LSNCPTLRFSDRVAHYIRARPEYPEAFFNSLRSEIGLRAHWAVADIGSGTGISAGPLLKNGNIVYGIEPNAPMRQAAERLLGAYPQFRSVDATAEVTSLPDRSVDLVLAAQAFHWFDRAKARREFARILRQGGWVVLVWNERRLDSTPFLQDYEQLLQAYATDYNRVRHENIDHEAIAAFFAPQRFQTRTFDNAQSFDYAGLEARLLSSSYTPGADDPRRVPMLHELRGIFERHRRGGRVSFEYDTRAHFGQLA
jgi:SAM-dependent methyltransferase